MPNSISRNYQNYTTTIELSEMIRGFFNFDIV